MHTHSCLTQSSRWLADSFSLSSLLRAAARAAELPVEIEAIGAEAIVRLMQINADIRRGLQPQESGIDIDSNQYNYNVRNVTLLENMAVKFEAIADCIDRMTHSLATMREGCHPFIFYHRVRPFLAGWKANPALPNGLKYEGVYVRWEDRPAYEDMTMRPQSETSAAPTSTRPRTSSKSRSAGGSSGGGVGWIGGREDKDSERDRAWSAAPLLRDVELGQGEDLHECPAQYFSVRRVLYCTVLSCVYERVTETERARPVCPVYLSCFCLTH